MSVLAMLALAAAANTSLPQCSWDRPGVNPFMGDVVAAVDRYQDIPAATRAKLKERMRARQYDDIAVIERDSIHGQASYGSDIRDMHFGQGSICRTVTRAKWTPTMQERGLVYCEDGQCILVPTVCRNVSRISRLNRPAAIAPAQAGTDPQLAATSTDDQMPLEFDPPAAGPLPATAPAAAPGSFAQQASLPAEATPSGSLVGSPAPQSTTPLVSGGSGGSAVPLPGLGIPPLPPGRDVTTPDITPGVPEPSTWALLALGLWVIAGHARSRARRH